MPVEEELAHFKPERDMLLTIGVFDGVHVGHRFLISRLVHEARERGLLSGAITFKEHPRLLFSPESSVPYLTTLAQRERLILEEGVDHIIPLTFDRGLANLTAREFLALLQKHLRMKGLVLGPDAAVGKDRTGTLEKVQELGEKMGFTVTGVPHRRVNGEITSSTGIRSALAEGDMPRVTRMLGRRHSLEGRVTTGDRRGAALGFPTANIDVDPRQALPPDGVYATWACLDGEARRSVTNIGQRPTFGAGSQRTIEVFILDYSGDIYGRELRIELVERLRPERRFENVAALRLQIEADVRRAREVLRSPGEDERCRKATQTVAK